MLTKLLKHEFRATARFMVPGILILLASSLAARLSLGGMLGAENSVLALAGGLLLTAYVFIVIGLTFVAYVYFIVRFCTNLMGREGYLMLTLPVSVHQQIWSKLITATVWLALVGLSILGSAALLLMGQVPLGVYLDFFGSQIDTILSNLNLDTLSLFIALLVLSVLTVMAGFLQFYAAVAVGCSFTNHKIVFTVLILIAMQFVGNLLGAGSPFAAMVDGSALMQDMVSQQTLVSTVWTSVLYNYAVVLVRGAVCYVAAAWFMKHRLNLE